MKCYNCNCAMSAYGDTLECEHCGDVIDRKEGLDGAVEDVKAFHRAMHQPIHTTLTTPGDDRVALRMSLILEEFEEVMESVYEDFKADHEETYSSIYWGEKFKVDHVDLADGLADLIYVCIGAANEFGIDLTAVWAEVHRSNMAKIGPNGEVKRREDGKVIKPDGWTPPDIKKALGIK